MPLEEARKGMSLQARKALRQRVFDKLREEGYDTDQAWAIANEKAGLSREEKGN